ncbi:MAG: AMP-binding protein, partial [Pseudonocardiaceae bacterium]
NTIIQGAWALLLSRYSATTNVCFGATVSGRPADLPGAEDITGIFINTLPVRVQIDHTVGVVSWLQQIQATQAETRQFDFVSLAQLQTFSEIPGGTSLFDSLVIFENYPINNQAATTHGLQLHELHASETTNYPLTLIVVPGPQLSLQLGYDPDLFDPATIERMAAHLQMLLGGIVADPDQPVSRLPMLTEAETQQVLVEWNDTERVVSSATLPGLLQSQVVRAPDSVAVVCEGVELSYGQLNARANRLAHKLIAAGVGPECCVAVALPRSVELIVALWAVLKAGAAFLPVDPDFPAERIGFVLADAAPVVVLDDPRAVGDTDGYSDADPTDGDRIHPLQPVNPAYVIYTSGSTGRPKGVVVAHCGIVNRLLW